jgi:RNA polymerase sigma factor (TIGR02999 family)
VLEGKLIDPPFALRYHCRAINFPKFLGNESGNPTERNEGHAMNATSTHEVTQLLQNWCAGDQAALDQLAPLIHSELHRLAGSYMSRERAGHLLQTSALINEAWLRLIEWQNVQWQNRAHFFGLAAQLMRRVLVDYARSRNAERHGGGAHAVELDDALQVFSSRAPDLVALDDALNTLATLNQRQSRVVELKFFGGLSNEEIAEVLQVSLRTVEREWTLARLWLLRELSK